MSLTTIGHHQRRTVLVTLLDSSLRLSKQDLACLNQVFLVLYSALTQTCMWSWPDANAECMLVQHMTKQTKELTGEVEDQEGKTE